MIDISILMPVYNAEKYLNETIDTIKNQSFSNWELIIVDDGSTDNSKEICAKAYQEAYKICEQPDMLKAYSPVENAQGKYIVFVDSDDLIHEDYLKILINSIEKNNSDISVCNFIERKISNTGKVEDITREFYPKEVMEMSEMKDYIMDFGNSGLLNPLWNKIYKREIIENNNITFDEKVETGEDFIFNLQYFRKTKKISFIKEKLYYYIRRNNNSITYKYIENMKEKLWLHSEEDINLLQIFYLETSRIKIDIKQMKRFGTFSNMVYQMAIYRIINTEISNVMPVLRLLYALVVNNIIVERETKLLFINLPRLMKDTTIGVEDFEKEARHKLNCRREICVIVSEYYKKGERNNNVLEWMELTKNSNEFVEIRNIEFE